MKIDDTDKHILRCLTANSRLSIRELSKLVNLSPPSVADRVRRMEDACIIEGYTAKINYSALGHTTHAILQISTKSGKCEEFRKFIAQHPNAEWCYRITGPADYIVKLTARRIEEIEQFIDDAARIADTSTHIILSKVGTESSLLQP
ncbi:Lrp/AsnC family transcriptional regulator [Peribacillus sp. SCS-26]|uniref:Lrp/AsnC family transcriptional regulator n=1 Tax=Paraperibacillus marinus TaxID=3115295 RepID=UPI00390680E2